MAKITLQSWQRQLILAHIENTIHGLKTEKPYQLIALKIATMTWSQLADIHKLTPKTTGNTNKDDKIKLHVDVKKRVKYLKALHKNQLSHEIKPGDIIEKLRKTQPQIFNDILNQHITTYKHKSNNTSRSYKNSRKLALRWADFTREIKRQFPELEHIKITPDHMKNFFYTHPGQKLLSLTQRAQIILFDNMSRSTCLAAKKQNKINIFELHV